MFLSFLKAPFSNSGMGSTGRSCQELAVGAGLQVPLVGWGPGYLAASTHALAGCHTYWWNISLQPYSGCHHFGGMTSIWASWLSLKQHLV